MTDLDDLPSEANPAATRPKCRHEWVVNDQWNGGPSDPPVRQCVRCNAVRDETVVRRNRRNRQRGASFERTVAKQLGGRRTGPLGGRDDVIVGEFAAIQTKKDGSLSLNKARAYLADLARTFPGRVPLVVHSEPGGDRNAVVILPLSWWRDLHGPDAVKETP